MTTLRVFDHTNRSMQRLGYLKYLTWRCSLSDASNLDALGRNLINTVAKRIQVELNPHLSEYVQRRLTDRIYKNLRETVKKIGKGREEQRTIPIELQDVYLASNELASRTGKLVSEDWRKYPYFLSSLGLVRKGTYSLLVRGKVFLQFVSKNEIDAFGRYNPNLNPFISTLEQKALLLYCLIENDGIILQDLYAKLVELNRVFSDREAGNNLPEIYGKVVKLYNSRARSGIEKDRLQRLLSSAKQIEKGRGKPYTGSGSWIHAITARLEPMVDLDLLEKPDPFSYEYRMNPRGKRLFETMVACNVDAFLESSFFEAVNLSFCFGATKASENEILNSVYESFEEIKSPLGYAPVKEIALLGAIRSFVNRKKYFEVGQASKLITEYQKSHPYALRFQVDRSGAPVYVKFTEKLEVAT